MCYIGFSYWVPVSIALVADLRSCACPIDTSNFNHSRLLLIVYARNGALLYAIFEIPVRRDLYMCYELVQPEIHPRPMA